MWRVLVLCVVLDCVSGQGRMLSPPGRSSMWRYGFDTPVNYNDNVLSCGGLKHRWEINHGKCGVCGDPFDQTPRDNEAGGKYSSQIISAIYISGSTAEVTVDVANADGGYFEFRLCANNNLTQAVSDDCINKGILQLDDKTTRYTAVREGLNTVLVKLPTGLECDQCVLQWKFNIGDHYGCEKDLTGAETCGFGKGKTQTEYFACADIAIYNADKVKSLEQQMQQGEASYTVVEATGSAGNSSPTHINKRMKRTPLHVMEGRRPGMPYMPFRGSVNIQFQPLSPVQWQWRPTPSPAPGRIRRRVQMPEGQQGGENMMMQEGMPQMSNIQNRGRPLGQQDRQVRLGFNMRRGQNFNYPFEELQAPPQPSLVRVEEPTVSSVPRRNMLPPHMQNMQGMLDLHNMQGLQGMQDLHGMQGMQGLQAMQPMGNMRTGPPLMPNMDTNTRLQRNFIDPYNTDFGSDVTVRKVTQTILSRQNTPTKQCQHCPFDQCLDDQLRIDRIFPGLFEEPNTFFECRKYEKLFRVGNYDILKEGLPECSHPRFKRQLMNTMMQDDDIGCCGTRPQVILPLTVESDNTSYNVVQLGSDKQQFIVQGMCGRSNTTSCTSCSAENNFQWVLVYDPRVNTQPPVSFVPVKFPHYCRCYNFRRTFLGK